MKCKVSRAMGAGSVCEKHMNYLVGCQHSPTVGCSSCMLHFKTKRQTNKTQQLYFILIAPLPPNPKIPCAARAHVSQAVIFLSGVVTLLRQQSSLAWVAIFAVVISVFMAAGRSALAFIYDSQKGHKREESG